MSSIRHSTSVSAEMDKAGMRDCKGEEVVVREGPEAKPRQASQLSQAAAGTGRIRDIQLSDPQIPRTPWKGMGCEGVSGRRKLENILRQRKDHSNSVCMRNLHPQHRWTPGSFYCYWQQEDQFMAQRPLEWLSWDQDLGYLLFVWLQGRNLASEPWFPFL